MTELLYGRNAVLEALRARRRNIQRLLIAEGVKENESLRAISEVAAERRIEPIRVDRHELKRRLGDINHQGVAVEVSAYPFESLDTLLEHAQALGEPPFLLILDHLQDPQNVGTLLRTAEVVGVHGVIFPERRAASVTPAVVNASAGAVEHLRIAQVTNLAQTLATLQAANVWIAGLEDDPQAQDFDAVDLRGPLALVIGAEGPGLARLIRERCDYLIRLPMRGHVASLNAATAGSIVLYYAWRARG